MTKGTRIKMKKLSAVLDPEVRTPSWMEFTPGQDNGNVSLPVDYEIEGALLAPIEIGQTICVGRTKRNGIDAAGILETSPIKNWDGKFAETANSRYEITPIV